MYDNNLDLLGTGKVFRDRESGEIVVRRHSLRRADPRDIETGAMDYDDDDELEGDFDDDDELSGDFDDDDDEDDEFGRRRRSRRRRRRRPVRRGRKGPRRRSSGRKKAARVNWAQTVISGGEKSATAGGAVSIKIRVQHDFKADDITFTETTDKSGAMVTSVFFGDRLVWSNPGGVNVTVFGTTGFMRGLLQGQQLKAGLDITINGNVGAKDDTLTAIIKGRKPVTSC